MSAQHVWPEGWPDVCPGTPSGRHHVTFNRQRFATRAEREATDVTTVECAHCDAPAVTTRRDVEHGPQDAFP